MYVGILSFLMMFINLFAACTANNNELTVMIHPEVQKHFEVSVYKSDGELASEVKLRGSTLKWRGSKAPTLTYVMAYLPHDQDEVLADRMRFSLMGLQPGSPVKFTLLLKGSDVTLNQVRSVEVYLTKPFERLF